MRLIRAGILGALVVAAALPQTARAGSVAAGWLSTSRQQSSSGLGILLSSGTSVPALPLVIQGSVLGALTKGGGYAATLEVRGLTGGGYGGGYVGAGAGIADLAGNQGAGTVLTLFAGKAIAPLTSIELRIYKQTADEAPVTAGFVGLRFSF
ncbi:MAG TPA: hypothetical protein VGZ02_06875 [Candidatus Baltobacteraceae bacterium]|jgi:hypothetical protein|nr:hypothetical protein [Candidatus Baltobacteraceae bacterium]